MKITVIPNGPKGRSGTQIKSHPPHLKPNPGPGSPLRGGRDDSKALG